MQKSLITKWLSISCIMVIAMIVIGGITRLTGSGLSIVEWRPITGILPPFSFEAWQAEFAKYKAFPEYNSVNYGMTLSQFKFIYLLEFIHRLLGRITALIYIVPLIYFYFKGIIKNRDIAPYIIALLLFCVQGFMGWYMVKSGLLNNPPVSHFRLAFHLIIAVIIYHILFYQLINRCDILLIPSQTDLKLPLIFSSVAITVIYLQIFLGALVAGLDAGLIYNSFPLMGDNFIPTEIKDNFFDLKNWYDPVFIQFIHRLGGYSVFLVVMALATYLLKTEHPKLNKIAYFLIIALLIQISTGIITLLYSVPIIIASTHQFFVIVLLSVVIWYYFLIKSSK
ncbi:MAG: COX15/CtaA family protein [Rickettsia endosymbiont of Ixodes persulcatus]|nr:COX15/CtaA family protein [Rickettsia endosymbiont of Ixodes persulcatus]MCZ6902861.1 COX15/CtaA family protein [Rickettsia endosymbiont of Ixodes persulcatus]MCZ6908861.1 COX15/CtaA family protein [Rickettsia endosymbiont of Ixodes persulcatus]MCZ6910842.1 COX15/CtaA family protein [Rickettsia endosymbiont of Ixodes persulcatus]MCZ6914213.1 COX15/CtaA family protein [Rickettsia endosymbiont of Ixodes persulcatus]